MATYTYPVNEQPLVRVDNCSGDILLTGWDESTVEITSNEDLHEQIHQDQGGDQTRIALNDVDANIELRVPRGAMVQITNGDGNVHVRDVAELEATNIAGDLLLENIAGTVRSTNLEGRLNVERAGDVAVRGAVEGDVRIAGATSAALESVEGDVLVEDVPTVRLGRVEGDLQLRNAAEQCDVGTVEGDVACRNARSLTVGHVDGDLAVDEVLVVMAGDIQGDVALRGSFDQITLGTIQGDFALQAYLTPGGTYRAHVLGDAAIHLPNNSNVTLQAHVVGNIKGAGVRIDHPTSVQLVWGGGEAALHLHVIGDLVIQGSAPANVQGGPGVYVHTTPDPDMAQLGRDLANMGRELAASFGPRAWTGKRGRRGNWRAEIGLGPKQKEQMKREVRQAVQSAVEQARAAVEQARPTIQQSLHEAGVAPPPTPTPAAPPAPPAPPSPPRTPEEATDPATGPTVPLEAQRAEEPTSDRDDERLAILRMVQEGTVTPEEAEDLLAALER